MTIREKIQELQNNMTPNMTNEERERLLLEIMTYQRIIDKSSLTADSDINKVSDYIKGEYSREFTQHGFFSEMSKNMTNEEAIQAASDPSALWNKVSGDIREAYHNVINANEEKFKKTHDKVITRREYIEKAVKNGWVMGSADRTLLSGIYDVAFHGGSDKYIELFDKVLNTDVKTVEARKAMLEEIKAAEPELNGMIYNSTAKKDVVTSKLAKFTAEPTQEELDTKIKEHDEKIKREEELRKVRAEKEKKLAEENAAKKNLFTQLKANGWKDPEAAANLYVMLKQTKNVKDQSKLDAALDTISKTKLTPGKEYTMQNVLISDAISLVMEETGNVSLGDDAKRLKNNYIKYYPQQTELEKKQQAELPDFKSKLKENGWDEKTVEANAKKMYFLCKFETSADMTDLNNMYDKLCNTKIASDHPSKEMKALMQELVGVAEKSNKKKKISLVNKSIDALKREEQKITQQEIENEEKAYFGFDKDVKAKENSREAEDILKKVGPTEVGIRYESMQANAARKNEKKAFAEEQEQLRAQRDARNKAYQENQNNNAEQDQIHEAQHEEVVSKLSPLVASLALKKGLFTTKNRSLINLNNMTRDLIANCDLTKKDGFTNEERVEKLIAVRNEAERLSEKKPEAKAVLDAVNVLLRDPVNIKVLAEMEEKADMAGGLHENAEEKEAAKQKANSVDDTWVIVEDERVTELRKDIQDITWDKETALAKADMAFDDTKKGFEEKKAAAAAAVSEIIAGKLYEKALSDLPKGAERPNKDAIMDYIRKGAADIREREDFKLMMADVIDKQDLQNLQGKAVNGKALIDELSRYSKIVQKNHAMQAKTSADSKAEPVKQAPGIQ